jgi:hypothetical protein
MNDNDADRAPIPVEDQANVPGGLMSLDPGTVPGKRPPQFGIKHYSRLPAAEPTVSLHDTLLIDLRP